MRQRKKIFFLFFIITCLLSCSSSRSDMEKIDILWNKITMASNSGDELIKVEELFDVLTDKHISFDISGTDSSGRVIDLQASDYHKIDTSRPVTMKFYITEDTVMVKDNWIPKRWNNVYYFYNE
ncbi:MAG: hypothetical protein K0R59_1999 [Sphingobacterium sp.]|nr:hypothetical protein [Sphingobacterium sp.]